MCSNFVARILIVHIFSVKSGPHPCVICKQIVEQSRAVSKAQAAQLGLKEEDVGSEGCRVCNKCWCNTLKKKHICPVPSCTSSKGRNRAKLRHLPSKWADLDARSKETIMEEMQLPEGSKRVCTACFTRITRRITQLEAVAGGESAKVKKEDESVKVAGCSKKIWLKWLQVTGAMSSSIPYIILVTVKV